MVGCLFHSYMTTSIPFDKHAIDRRCLLYLEGEFSFFQGINLIYKKMLLSSEHAKQSCKERIYQTSTGPVKTLIT